MPETFLDWLTQQCRWKRSHFANRADMLFFKPRAWLGGQVLMWPLYVISLMWTEHLGAGALILLTASAAGHIMDSTVPLVQQSECAPWSVMVFISIWILVVIYCGLSAGMDVKQRPILHNIAMFLAFVASLCILIFLLFGLSLIGGLLFGILLLLPGLVMFAVQVLHGMRRPWVPLLAFITPCLALLKAVVQTSVAAANVDGTKAGWGTRGAQGETIARNAALALACQIRVYKRRVFLALWLSSNYAISASVLVLKAEIPFAAVMLVAFNAFLLTHLVLGFGYSIMQRIPQKVKSAKTSYGSV